MIEVNVDAEPQKAGCRWPTPAARRAPAFAQRPAAEGLLCVPARTTTPSTPCRLCALRELGHPGTASSRWESDDLEVAIEEGATWPIGPPSRPAPVTLSSRACGRLRRRALGRVGWREDGGGDDVRRPPASKLSIAAWVVPRARDVAAQRRGRIAAGADQLPAPEKFARERGGDVGGQACGDAGLGHRFGEQVDIGGARAAERGDGVHEALFDPLHDADGAEHRLGDLHVGVRCVRAFCDRRRAYCHERGRVGHRPHDARALAQPCFDGRKGNAGGDRDDERRVREHGGELGQQSRQRLRLRAQHHNVADAYRVEVRGGGVEAVFFAAGPARRRVGHWR